MEQNLIDIYDLIEHAIDNAFEGQMNLKFYDYLKDNKIKKHELMLLLRALLHGKSVRLHWTLMNISKVVKIMNTNNCERVMVIFQNLKQEK